MFDKWQAPDRDSPSIEMDWQVKLTLDAEVNMTDQLKALLRMEGYDGYKEDVVKSKTGVDVDRPRRWHLMFERMGLLYRINDQTHLTDLGKEVLRTSQSDPKLDLAKKSLVTLSRYQLKNPVDEEDDTYPDNCDIHPYWAMWKACDALDGRLHWDEFNREIMRVLRHADLDPAIEKLRAARLQPGYDPVGGGTAAAPLSERCYDNTTPPEGRTGAGQVRDQITTPWLKRASLGEYLLSLPGRDGRGYWSIRPEFQELIHDWVSKGPPPFRRFTSKDEWYRFLSGQTVTVTGRPVTEIVNAISADLAPTGLRFSSPPLLRFTASLLSKRFLILTGLAGSGKTKLAQAFAHWLTPDPELVDPADPPKGKNPNPFFALVPVGADWTGNENILGYPDGLRPPTVTAEGAKHDGAYLTKPALDLITHALTHKDVPHLLILDEMNLSHVERYFADMLSMIESQMSITLYCDDKGPDGRPTKTRGMDPILTLPPNLFIIGTVNVDETTYMFSPKVLDRANVIEFRVTPEEMGVFLGSPTAPDLDQLDGKGLPFAPQFVTAAAQKPNALIPNEQARYTAEMSLFFAILREHGAEFGYRVAHEAARFLHYYSLLSQAKCWQEKEDGPPVVPADWVAKDTKNRDWFDHAFDAVVIQKFLPKLHGSKVKLGPLLRKVYTACLQPHADTPRDFKATAATLNDPKAAAQLKEPSRDIPKDARYPVTAEKVSRMWRQLNENGFTSFPEN